MKLSPNSYTLLKRTVHMQNEAWLFFDVLWLVRNIIRRYHRNNTGTLKGQLVQSLTERFIIPTAERVLKKQWAAISWLSSLHNDQDIFGSNVFVDSQHPDSSNPQRIDIEPRFVNHASIFHSKLAKFWCSITKSLLEDMNARFAT